MQRQKAKTYTGVLAEPMKISEGVREQYEARMIALAEHYGADTLDENGLFTIVSGLAEDHVPGFSFEEDPIFEFTRIVPIRDFIMMMEIFRRTKRGGGDMSVRKAAIDYAEAFPHHGLNGESARVRYEEMTAEKKSNRGQKITLNVLKALLEFRNSDVLKALVEDKNCDEGKKL